MSLRFGPVNRFLLSFRRVEHIVCMILHHVIVDPRPLRSSFGASFYVNICHVLHSRLAQFASAARLLDYEFAPFISDPQICSVFGTWEPKVSF
jgi:hypothetical protein